MKLFVASLITSLALVGQMLGQVAPPTPVPASSGVVACKLSIESSVTMKSLYGNKVPLFTGNIVCKNYSTVIVGPVGSADMYLALATVNTMTASDASALLTKAYGRSVASQMGTAVTSANTGVSLLAGLKQLSISASSLGWAGFGVGIFSQAILPFFTAGQPNLTTLLSNQCDSLQSVSLSPGQSISCTIYIQKPAKGVALPGAVAFDLEPVGPPTPGPLPPVAPVQLRPRRAMYHVDSSVTDSDKIITATADESALRTDAIMKARQDALAHKDDKVEEPHYFSTNLKLGKSTDTVEVGSIKVPATSITLSEQPSTVKFIAAPGQAYSTSGTNGNEQIRVLQKQVQEALAKVDALQHELSGLASTLNTTSQNLAPQ